MPSALMYSKHFKSKFYVYRVQRRRAFACLVTHEITLCVDSLRRLIEHTRERRASSSKFSGAYTSAASPMNMHSRTDSPINLFV